MIESLNWVTLREHRKIARLSFFHEIASVVNIPQHFLDTLATTIHFILSTSFYPPKHKHHSNIETATSQELLNSLSTSLIKWLIRNYF